MAGAVDERQQLQVLCEAIREFAEWVTERK
jgi:hypothetical protein